MRFPRKQKSSTHKAKITIIGELPLKASLGTSGFEVKPSELLIGDKSVLRL
jgi:hypothetical protein